MTNGRIINGGVTSNSARLRINLSNPTALTAFSPDAVLITDRAGTATPSKVAWVSEGECVLDVSNLLPNTVYTARLTAELGVGTRFRTAPAALTPTTPLLVGCTSCYFPSDHFLHNPYAIAGCFAKRSGRQLPLDPDPTLSNPMSVDRVADEALPHACFLGGDQIYADVPANWDGTDDARLYQARYHAAWQQSRLGPLLDLGGNFFLCDDHEFWNDFPEDNPQLSRDDNSRWASIAAAAYDPFWKNQGLWNFPRGFIGGAKPRSPWARGMLANVDVFLADTRSTRTTKDGKRRPDDWNEVYSKRPRESAARFMEADQFDALIDWIGQIQTVGILVIPQPLVQASGKKYDKALADFSKQFRPLMDAIWSAVHKKGKSIIVLTGDIHWSRLMQFRSYDSGASLVEFVASPIGRVGIPSSYVSTLFDGGERSDEPNKFHEEEARVLGYTNNIEVIRHFASSENNCGILELGITNSHLTAIFETWSLKTRSLANNAWMINSADCKAYVRL